MDTKQVYEQIRPYIKETPLLHSEYYSELLEADIYFKCENLQISNCFKIRGATNKLLKIKDQGQSGFQIKNVIAASGGNHGLAVGIAAKNFGINAVIVVPEYTLEYRINLIKETGAEVIKYGKTFDDLNAKVKEYTDTGEYTYIHPFDDEDVIAGQSTIAYELFQQKPDLDIVIASIGGGGLISGISQYTKEFKSTTKVYGVETVGADSMYQSIEADKLIALPAITSIATSLGATKVTERTFEIVKKYVDKVVRVSDDQAIKELITILSREKLLVEPATSCCLAALTNNQIPDFKGKKVAVIICGGNQSVEQVLQFFKEQ